MGGGSSSVPAHYLRSPLDALRDRLGPDVEVEHEGAVDISRTSPEVPASCLAVDGTPGLAVEFFRADDAGGEVIHTATNATGAVVWFGRPPRQVGPTFSWRAYADLTVEEAGRWTISLVQTDPARLLVDGHVVLDGFAEPPGPGHDLFGLAREEVTVTLDLSPEDPVRIEVQSTVRGPATVTGAKVGIRRAPPVDGIERAVAAAARADAVILVVGTDENWETEGADRESMHLPGDQDDLVRRVLEVAPHAVVVLNVGAPVATPWAADAGAVVQCWFGGQEMAEGLADVLLGEADPGGRLPTTIPVRLQDSAVVGELGARGWSAAVRRGGPGRVPLVRVTRDRGVVPLRPRPVVHELRDRGTRTVGHVDRTRWERPGAGAGHQHRRPTGTGGGPGLRGPGTPGGVPAPQGVEGVRQGVPRSGGVGRRGRGPR